MKIEKLSNNKLKVVFSINDLEKENINYQSFMAGSTKYENVLSELLYIAKTELDFDTQNCNIEIETFEITHGNFILTITKFEKNLRKLKAKRKQVNLENNFCIYEFKNLDDYYEFTNFLKKHMEKIYKTFEKTFELYSIFDKYLLIIDGTKFLDNEAKIFNTLITEFATFKSNSIVLISKIKEIKENF